MKASLFFCLFIFSLLILTSFNTVDFGSGRYILKGNIYIDNQLLTNDTIAILPIWGNNKPDFENRKKIFVNQAGDFQTLVEYIVPCTSGGAFAECKKKEKIQGECWDNFFAINNYSKLNIGKNGKVASYLFPKKAKEDFLKHTSENYKDTFIIVQNFYLK